MTKKKIYAWTVVLATVALLGWLFAEGVSWPSIPAVVFWIIALAIVDLLPVTLGFGTEVTMAIPIHLALAILYPPAVSMTIVGLSAFDTRELRREIDLHHALFNRAQLMLVIAVASGTISLARDEVFTFPTGWLVVGGAVILHVIVNLGLVSLWVHFSREVPLRAAAQELLPDPPAGFWISYALLSGLGVVTALAFDRIGAWAVAAILVPVLFARLSILGARAQQELSERIQKQQHALLEATEQVFQEREKERHRIAAEIHDSSLQLLAAAAYGVGNAKELIAAGSSDQALELITSSRQAIDDAMKELRESLVDLRQSTVEEGGLLPTVQHYAEQLGTLWGTDVVIEGELSNEPPLPVALAAFQILQEGLVNALKHAQNSSVVVRIGDEDGMVHIVVEDQGPGFDPTEEVGADHVGMRLMRERAERVGGRIDLDSKPGIGTRLEAILPGGVTQ